MWGRNILESYDNLNAQLTLEKICVIKDSIFIVKVKTSTKNGAVSVGIYSYSAKPS